MLTYAAPKEHRTPYTPYELFATLTAHIHHQCKSYLPLLFHSLSPSHLLLAYILTFTVQLRLEQPLSDNESCGPGARTLAAQRRLRIHVALLACYKCAASGLRATVCREEFALRYEDRSLAVFTCVLTHRPSESVGLWVDPYTNGSTHWPTV